MDRTLDADSLAVLDRLKKDGSFDEIRHKVRVAVSHTSLARTAEQTTSP